MAEPGGPTTQSGIRYQNSITALYLGRLLDLRYRPDSEFVSHVRVEAREPVDDIVVTYVDDHRAYIQVKESLSSSDNAWQKVWQDFKKQFYSESFQKGKDILTLHIGEQPKHIKLLKELCNRAQRNDNFEEWHDRLSKEQKALLHKVETILHGTEPNEGVGIFHPPTLLSFFQHLQVNVWPSDSIEQGYVTNWMPESNTTQVALFRLLRDEVSSEASIRGSFSASALRDTLKKKAQVDIAKPLDLERVRESFLGASSLLRTTKHTIGEAKDKISQPIVEDIVDWATASSDDQKNVAMLIDQAGFGKTVVFRDVLVELEGHKVAVLGIKSDQQLSGVTKLQEIQENLHLDYPIESSVERLAKLDRVVILIDQLDALSLTMAHDQRTLNVVLDLVARLRRIPNVRILISCRLFDKNNDTRLRQIEAAREFRLPRLQLESVTKILDQIGVDYGALSSHTLELLRVPLHLDLFVQTAEKTNNFANIPQNVRSLQDLYGHIWEYVIFRQLPDTPSKAERLEVLDELTNYMDHHREVSAPYSLFQTPDLASLDNAVNWLASAGILVGGERGWTFLHQTFFDYCYARRLVEKGENFTETILNSEQGLFERTKLIQMISYLRGTNGKQYLITLNKLLNASQLRYHLKDLIIRWLGSVSDPWEEEWVLVRRLLVNIHTRAVLMNSMSGNNAWLPKLEETFLDSWLKDDGVTDHLVMPYLQSIFEIDPTRVISIVRQFIGKGDKWNNRIAFIFLRIRSWESKEILDLYEMHFKQSESWRRPYQLIEIAEADPVVACRLIEFVLQQVLDQYLEDRSREIEKLGVNFTYGGATKYLFQALESFHGTRLDRAIAIVSDCEPKRFINAFLPWLEKVVTYRGNEIDNAYKYAWDELSIDPYNEFFTTQKAIIQGLTDALIKTARKDAIFFDEVSSKLKALPYETPQHILANVYASDPEYFANFCHEFLMADQRRLMIGTQGYESRRLLNAVYPYLNVEQRNSLEVAILSYAPVHKSPGLAGLHWRGIEQLFLLQAVPRAYLSTVATRRLDEWERKFPGSRASEEPIKGEWGTVGSPIPQENAEKMSDRAWLRAMEKYRGNVEHRDFLKGGAQELGRVLEALVPNNPQRFARLFKDAPDNVDDAYIVALLNGLADSVASAELLFTATRRFSVRKSRAVRLSIVRALGKKVKNGEVPDDLKEMLLEWLNEAPGDDEWSWLGEGHGKDIYHTYINAVRCQSFDILLRIYDAQGSEETRQEKWRLIEFAASDDSTALRLGAIYELTFLIRHDRSRAASLFDRLMEGHPRLLESRFVGDFIYYGFHRNFLHFSPYITSMMEHGLDSVQEYGAQLACVAALSTRAMESDSASVQAHDLAQKALSGPPACRRGAARVYSYNITGDSLETCMRNIIHLLDDDDEQVLRHINTIFSRIREEHLLPLRDLLDTYAERAKIFDSEFSKHLFSFGLSDPKWALVTTRTYAKRARQQAQHPYVFGLEDLIRLVLQIYTHPFTDEELRRDAMDVFDSLMEDYSGEALSILKEWDSR